VFFSQRCSITLNLPFPYLKLTVDVAHASLMAPNTSECFLVLLVWPFGIKVTYDYCLYLLFLTEGLRKRVGVLLFMLVKLCKMRLPPCDLELRGAVCL
jgi:hypothetical protein